MDRRLVVGAGVLIGIVAIVIVLSLAGGGDDEAAPTTVPATTSTTTTTTTQPPPTTARPAEFTYAGDGQVPELDAEVEVLYRALAGEAVEPAAAPWVLERISAVAPLPLTGVQTQTSVAELKYGPRVAVVHNGDDIVLAASDAPGAPWQIVGIKMPGRGIEATYGPPVRRVLVLGSDARWNQDALAQRADSIHVVTAVPAQAAGSIVGVPRDSWVASPSGGRTKINGILTSHGPEGLVETVGRLWDVEVEGYIITGFLGFEVMMREFGPLPVDLPNRIRGGLPGFPNFPEGPQEIGAEDLLLLARIRKTLPNGDFDRQFNHGIIMQAGIDAVQERGIVVLPQLIKILEDSSWTDLAASELLTLGATAYELDSSLVTNHVIPGSVGATSGGASIVRVGGGAVAMFADQNDDGLINSP